MLESAKSGYRWRRPEVGSKANENLPERRYACSSSPDSGLTFFSWRLEHTVVARVPLSPHVPRLQHNFAPLLRKRAAVSGFAKVAIMAASIAI